MSKFSTNEFKSGLKVMLDHDPCSIMENEYVKPGKGQAFNRVKLRNLKNGRIIERTFKSGDSLDSADVVEMDMQYLYFDGEFWHFMQPDTFEQISVDATVVTPAKDWLKEQALYIVTMWNGTPLSIEPPNSVILKVVETDPGIKGDTVSGGSKSAKLESGAIVRVPLFVNEGDLLKIDTRTGEYISRSKE